MAAPEGPMLDSFLLETIRAGRQDWTDRALAEYFNLPLADIRASLSRLAAAGKVMQTGQETRRVAIREGGK